MLLVPFYECESEGLESLVNLLKITKKLSEGSGFQDTYGCPYTRLQFQYQLLNTRKRKKTEERIILKTSHEQENVLG